MNLPTASLQRFVEAQSAVYETVRTELAEGRKRSHWMWFVFPQLKGLGFSSTAQFYGLDGADEARAYWQHPVLGRRLAECLGQILAVPGATAHDIFGSPDDLKLRSCITLFQAVAPNEPVFTETLQRFYRGQPDPRTLELLAD